MLGKPKHGGKDEENLTHFFRHYRSSPGEYCFYMIGGFPLERGKAPKKILPVALKATGNQSNESNYSETGRTEYPYGR